MNKKQTALSLVILGMLFSSQIIAQNLYQPFGKITPEEIKMTESPVNPEAPALTLFDIGKSEFIQFDGRLYIRFRRHTRIKIFDKSASDYADVSVLYYHGSSDERVQNIEARSYNYTDGKLEQADINKENIYTEKISKKWSQKKFAIPKVRENTIIEYKYEILTPYVFQYRGWEFQTEIPCLYSEYSASMVPFYEYAILKQGALKFDTDTSYIEKGLPEYFAGIEYRVKTYKYAVKNIPAFKEEEFMTTKDDYISKLDFQLSKINRPDGSTEQIMNTWDKLVLDLLLNPDFGKYAKPNALTKSIVSDLDIKTLSPEEKIEKITNYVKQHYDWDGQYGIYTEKSKKEFHNIGNGNIAELNLFLSALLNSAGVEAYPVLLSTRKHGKIKQNYPFLHYFNYVIVVAVTNGKYTILDASEPFLPVGDFPPKCLNDYALMVKKKDAGILKLHDITNSYKKINLILKLNPETNTLEGSCMIIANDYDAMYMRRKYFSKKEDGFIEDYTKDLIDAEFTDFEFKNTEDLDKPFQMSFKVSVPVDETGDMLFLKPLLFFAKEENPLKLDNRTYPVDFTYRRKKIIRVSIMLPPNYKIEELPKSEMYQTTDKTASFQYVSSNTGNVIQTASMETISKATYEVSQYQELKEMFNQIIKKQNERITVKK